MREQGGDPFANAKTPTSNLSELYEGTTETDVPTARALGERHRRLREALEISIDEVAKRCDLSSEAIEDFERSGLATAETLLTLINAMSADHNLHHAFRTPKFDHIDQLVAWGRRQSN